MSDNQIISMENIRKNLLIKNLNYEVVVLNFFIIYIYFII